MEEQRLTVGEIAYLMRTVGERRGSMEPAGPRWREDKERSENVESHESL